MGEKIIYLLKGLLFSSFLTGILMLLVAFLMYQAGLSETAAAPMVVAAYVLSAFLGGIYFAKHGEKRRFLWGMVFGLSFYVVYLLVSACAGSLTDMKTGEVVSMLAFSVAAGMVGGMVS